MQARAFIQTAANTRVKAGGRSLELSVWDALNKRRHNINKEGLASLVMYQISAKNGRKPNAA